MIRAVVAVAVAAALLSASLPAVETARVERTTAAIERVPDRIDRAALSTLAGEPERRPSTGSAPTARRVVSIPVPGGSVATAPVRSLSLCPGDERGTAVLVSAVGDAVPSRTVLSAPYDLPNGGIALDRGRRVSLSLVPIGSGPGGTTRRVRVRLRTPPTPSAGSSTETEPARPCDSSTTSATASATDGVPTTADAPGVAAGAPPSSQPVRSPVTDRVPIPVR
ncbi:DUF7311 family protein [Halobaculum rubrum]|uniref:DUF7311 family protein n=1 Tax=Halobaculum rubrum TaxID=2872158 RepID=UPI001CA4237A|nr:hypothetical protein [Halobaculum rubrum]QZX99730.1 hypothetical protein K6T25_01065 [Halobaculum rubrum]